MSTKRKTYTAKISLESDLSQPNQKVIALYPTLFKPRKNEKSGKDQYSIAVLIDKNDEVNKGELRKARVSIEQKVFAATGGKVPEHLKEKWKTPVKDGDKHIEFQTATLAHKLATGEIDKETHDRRLADLNVYKGKLFVNLKHTPREGFERPYCVDQDIKDVMEKDGVSSGAIINLRGVFFDFDIDGGIGITAGLEGVQITGKSVPLNLSSSGGKPEKSSLFKKIGKSENQEAYTNTAQFDADESY